MIFSPIRSLILSRVLHLVDQWSYVAFLASRIRSLMRVVTEFFALLSFCALSYRVDFCVPCFLKISPNFETSEEDSHQKNCFLAQKFVKWKPIADEEIFLLISMWYSGCFLVIHKTNYCDTLVSVRLPVRIRFQCQKTAIFEIFTIASLIILILNKVQVRSTGCRHEWSIFQVP